MISLIKQFLLSHLVNHNKYELTITFNQQKLKFDGAIYAVYNYDDALGRRVQRYFRGTKENTKFIYDGQDVLVDDNSGTLTKDLNGQGIDNKLRALNGSNASYFLADHLGSTNGLTDSSGNLTASTNYDAFGNATNANFPTRYQFTGREHDNFTGLQYSRARFYDANLGRFISEDPIGFAGSDVNLYGYVWNNPTAWKDPSGLRIGGVAGGASLWGGAVLGGGGTAGTLVGYSSHDGIGSASSYGYFYGPGKTPADTTRNSGWAIGGSAGVGAGIFYSNADRFDQLDGNFSTTLLGFGSIGTIQYDTDCQSGIYVIQAYPGPLGKGPSYGVAHLGTYTPPTTTGGFMDSVEDFKRKVVNGIRNLYGY